MRNFVNAALLVAILAGPSAAAGKKNAPSPAAALPDIMVTVNGVPVKRADVQDRTWRRYATGVLNEMVDEILIQQAAEKLALKADSQEIAARIKRIQDQFQDEATFKQRLAASGTSLDELHSQIESQVLRENLVLKARDLKVSDQEVKEFFDANKEKLASPDAVRLRSILVASEKEANDFLVALRAGADFAKLASQVSLDQNSKFKGGDLGYISKGMLQPNLEQAAFALKPGELSAPIALQSGVLLLKAEEFKPAKPAVFTEIEKDLRQGMLANKITAAWPVYLKELHDTAHIKTDAAPAKPALKPGK